MGTYGTATGIIQGIKPVTNEPMWLMLVNGEIVGSFTETGGVVATRGELAGMALDTTSMIRERTIDFALAEGIPADGVVVGDFIYYALSQTSTPAIMRWSVTSGQRTTVYLPELRGYGQIRGITADNDSLFLVLDGAPEGEVALAARVEMASLAVIESIEIGRSFADDIVIDPDHTYLYARTREGGAPGYYVLSKILAETFTLVDELSIGHGSPEGKLAINASHLFASSRYSGGSIVRVNLDDFATSTVKSFSFGTDYPVSLAVDATHLYVASETSPGRILRVLLSDFSTAEELTFSSGYNTPRFLDLDETYLFAACYTSPGRFVRVLLSDFSTVAYTDLSAGLQYSLTCHATTRYVSAGLTYANGTGSVPGIVRIPYSDFDGSGGELTSFSLGDMFPLAIVCNAGYAYVGFSQVNAVKDSLVARIPLSDEGKIDLLATGVADTNIACLHVIDGFLYAGATSSPGKVTKIDLTTWSVVSSLTLSTGANSPVSMVSVDGFLYVCCESKVVKIDLSDFTEDSTYTTAATLNAVAADASYLYLAHAVDEPGQVTRVALSDFSTDDTLVLSAGGPISSLVVDSFLYAGSDGVPGLVFKIDMADFTEEAALELIASNYVGDMVIAAGSLFAGLTIEPPTLIRVYLDTFTEGETITVDPDENYVTTTICASGTTLYAGTSNMQIVVVKIDSPSLQPATGEGFALLDENGDPAISYDAEDVLVLGSSVLQVLVNGSRLLIKAPVSLLGNMIVEGGFSAQTVGADLLVARNGFRLQEGIADMNGRRMLDAVLDLPVLSAAPDSPENGEVWLYSGTAATRNVVQGLPFLHRKAVAGATGDPELRAFIDNATYKVALTAV